MTTEDTLEVLDAVYEANRRNRNIFLGVLGAGLLIGGLALLSANKDSK